MDKSPSIKCQQIDDGSWDLDEDENKEDHLLSSDNLSCNSWDSTSEKGCKLKNVSEKFCEDNFKKEDVVEDTLSSDSWGSSASNKRIIKAVERPQDSHSESNSCEDVEVQEIDHFDVVEKFEGSPVCETYEGSFPVEDNPPLKTPLNGKAFDLEEITSNDEGGILFSVNRFEQCLVVEDLEESVVKNTDPSDSGDDASIWKIPLSGRSEFSDGTSVILRNLKTGRFTRRKSKSDPNFSRRSKTLNKSKSADNLVVQGEFNLKDAVMQFEGSHLRKVKDGKGQDALANILDLGHTATHFQEVECRTLRTIVANVKKEGLEVESEEVKEGPERSENHPRLYVGTSSNISEEAVSLPDIAEAGRSDMKKKHEFRRAVSHTTNHNLMFENNLEKDPTESWILLDEMGQSQTVTLTEVSFLLNGRSADTVLQENKEHFIPKSTVVRNATSDHLMDRWNPLVEESLQHFLNEEDPGGEESSPKSIGLERKFGNMLLYIQSGVNLTSSVRFIPVDVEMIHMWRQSKENVSPISSEDDAQVNICENVAEEASDFENHEISDEVRCRLHDSRAAVRKRRTRQSRADDDEHWMVENRRIIESLTDDIKQLKMRLEAERSRSSSLEQEIYRLRGQLDKCKSGQNSEDSQNPKSEITEGYKKTEISYIPQITSSSLLSIEEFRLGKDGITNENERPNLLLSNNRGSLSSLEDDQKSFKKSLDKSLSDIEEILKCRNRSKIKSGPDISVKASGAKSEHFEADNSTISTSASVNSCAVLETNSQVLSDTTGSLESWFKPMKKDTMQRNISDIINDLENKNENLVVENLNLKKKLNEISIELDEYVSSCMIPSPIEESRQTESLRKQVCNLKLELENLKSLTKSKEQSFKLKDAIVREELAEKSVSLEEWRTSIINIFSDVDKSREKLFEIGFSIPDLSLEMAKLTPNDLLSQLRSLMTQIMSKMLDFKNENSVLRKSLQDNFLYSEKNLMIGIDRSYGVNFLREMPDAVFGNKNDENKALLSDKLRLEEEMQNLRRENDLLLECQIEQNENLKKVTMALREERSKVESLEKTLRITELEKKEISEALAAYQKERTIVETELQMERAKSMDLKIDLEKKRNEVTELMEKIQEDSEKYRSFDETFALKEEKIEELKRNCSELESRESHNSSIISNLGEQLKKLEEEKSELEEELLSTKQIAEESTRGMSEYITHLETMVRNAEDNVAEMKEKFNETFKSLATLKKAHENLEKENELNMKMYNKTKEELKECRDVTRNLEESNRKSEEMKKKALCDLNAIVKSEREKTETLEKLVTQRKILDDEISTLKVTAETQMKAKDRLLKEQKDLINEIAILRKENQKLGQKYRNVKSECNERTKLLKRLDGKLRENFLEYNKRIAWLERNVSNIIEKAVAYKDAFLERRTETNAVVRELQQQLDLANSEKKDLEDEAASFCAAMKRLQKELNQRKRGKSFDFVLDNAPNEDHPKRVPDESYDGSKNVDNDPEKVSRKAEMDAQEKIRELESSKDEDRQKYESIIADLKSQVTNYRLRLEVLLKNISAYGKSTKEETDKSLLASGVGGGGGGGIHLTDSLDSVPVQNDAPSKNKSSQQIFQLRKDTPTSHSCLKPYLSLWRSEAAPCSPEEQDAESTPKILAMEQKIRELTEELDRKRARMIELTEVIENNEIEMNKKGDECEALREKVLNLKGEIKNMKNQFSKLQEFLSTVNKNVESYQKERDEVAGKLAKSLKLIMEERASKQSSETVYMEKEKLFKDQIDQLQIRLTEKKNDYEGLLKSMEEKVALINKLQEDVKKWKSEVAILKAQVTAMKDRNNCRRESISQESYQEGESKQKELKEVRALNLELRKAEGVLRASVVRLEDELRGARLLIKELEGDLRAEKISKKLLKEVIASAKDEIDKFKRSGQIMASVADKIERHFNLSEAQSRESFSVYRAPGELTSSNFHSIS